MANTEVFKNGKMVCHNKVYYSFLVLLIFLNLSCNTYFQKTISNQQNIPIQFDSLNLYDSNAHYLIEPYRMQLSMKMEEIIGFTQTSLTKEKPSGSLNNFMADACINQCKTKLNIEADFAVFNYGGIRIPSIPAGDIKLGKVYELMPFENQLVFLKLKGSNVLKLMQLITSQNGWPISGVKLRIKNREVIEVTIQDKPLDTNYVYSLITSDYLANGGDKAIMLQHALSRIELNYLLRDALIDYIKSKPNYSLFKDERITYEP
jgi:2',3'-cyclic-nucleotide 2'-phosphodiesterase (5'-nucleotidase family)